ncbi:MAG: type IV pilin protein [Succinivibrionaceae bacterium]
MIRNSKGFTLIELMIVITIIAILGVIAIPGYGNYVRESRRSAVKQELTKLVNVLENCYSLNQTYEGCLANVGALPTLSDDTAPYYQFNNATQIQANDFRLVVQARGSQTSDLQNCQFLGIDRVGIRFSGNSATVVNDRNNRCW